MSVDEVFYGLMEYDARVAMSRGHRRFTMPENYVYAQEVGVIDKRGIATVELMATLVGVGSVSDYERMWLVGTERGLESFRALGAWRSRMGLTMARVMDCLTLPVTPSSTNVTEAREYRINLPGVKDEVAGTWPQLRDWDAGSDVVIVPSAPGLRAGGILRPFTYYTGGRVFRDLNLRSPAL